MSEPKGVSGPALAQPRPAPKRILIVEDERIVALDLGEALEDLGYAVTATVATADDALSAVARERPDLVLMDIRIDGPRDGIAAARAIHERDHLPVVFLTANADPATLEHALGSEPAGYLVKPFNPPSLRTTIEVALRRHNTERNLRESQEIERRAFAVERDRLTQEVSAAAQRAERYRRDATTDPLTGLYNRRHFERALERELGLARRERRPVGLIFIDLDHFKRVNDVHGHRGGDAVLRACGGYLRARLRIYDVACRYGGEELVIVVPGADAASTAILAEHLRAGIAGLAVTDLGIALPPVTASFGVAAFPEHGNDVDALVRVADAALYRAKADGRNRVASGPGA